MRQENIGPVIQPDSDEAMEFVVEVMAALYGVGTECCAMFMLGTQCDCKGPKPILN